MIAKDSLMPIGELHKPHGVKGELSASFDNPDLDPSDLRCLVLDMDGIPVPFFLESARRRGAASWLLKFEGADDEKSAMRLARHEVFALRAEMPEDDESADGVYLHDLIGYTVADADDESVGTVADIDDSTSNTLLIIDRGDGRGEAMVPFSDDLLLWLDTERHALGLDIPAGVLDLND